MNFTDMFFRQPGQISYSDYGTREINNVAYLFERRKNDEKFLGEEAYTLLTMLKSHFADTEILDKEKVADIDEKRATLTDIHFIVWVDSNDKIIGSCVVLIACYDCSGWCSEIYMYNWGFAHPMSDKARDFAEAFLKKFAVQMPSEIMAAERKRLGIEQTS